MFEQEGNWQGIEMLPVADEMISEEVNEAHARLLWLSSAKDTKQIVNSEHLQQLIGLYDEKNMLVARLKAQCAHWRSTIHLTDKQKEMLTSLERSLVTFEKACYQGLVEIQKLVEAPQAVPC